MDGHHPKQEGTKTMIDFLLGFSFVTLVLSPLVVAYTRQPSPVRVSRHGATKR
jgi:hypothetical protein